MSRPANSKGKKKVPASPSCRAARMKDLDIDLQTRLDIPFRNERYMMQRVLRFKISDQVIFFSAEYNLYYVATIKKLKGLVVPPTIYEGEHKAAVPMHMRVASYTLHFEGWGEEHNCETPDNELLTTVFPERPVDTLGMLVAHEVNLLRRDYLEIGDRDLGVSAFLMDSEMYAKVEAAWQASTGETMSFGQFCGREPGPFHSEP